MWKKISIWTRALWIAMHMSSMNLRSWRADVVWTLIEYWISILAHVHLPFIQVSKLNIALPWVHYLRMYGQLCRFLAETGEWPTFEDGIRMPCSRFTHTVSALRTARCRFCEPVEPTSDACWAAAQIQHGQILNSFQMHNKNTPISIGLGFECAYSSHTATP